LSNALNVNRIVSGWELKHPLKSPVRISWEKYVLTTAVVDQMAAIY